MTYRVFTDAMLKYKVAHMDKYISCNIQSHMTA